MTPWAVAGCGYVSEQEKSREDTVLDSHVISRNGTWYEFDITDAVRAWVGNAATNQGVELLGFEMFSRN